MKECLIDTDVFSYYMRGLSDVVYRAQEYLKQFGCFSISSLTIFEILKGLRKKRLVEKENVFQMEILKHKIVALDYFIMDRAASLLSTLEEKGTPIAYGDLFIGATALTHDLILVTNNTQHFSKIDGLVLENWRNP